MVSNRRLWCASSRSFRQIAHQTEAVSRWLRLFEQERGSAPLLATARYQVCGRQVQPSISARTRNSCAVAALRVATRMASSVPGTVAAPVNAATAPVLDTNHVIEAAVAAHAATPNATRPHG